MSYLWLYSGGLQYILTGAVFFGGSCLAAAWILIAAGKRRQAEEQDFAEKMQKLSAGKSINNKERETELLEEETDLLTEVIAEGKILETELLNHSEETELLGEETALLNDRDETEYLEEETELLNDQEETEYFTDDTEVLDRS